MFKKTFVISKLFTINQKEMNLETTLQTMKNRIRLMENTEVVTSGDTNEIVLTALALKALAAHKVVKKAKQGYQQLASKTNQSNPV